MDAHIFGKSILPLYRQLFTFTSALMIAVGEEAPKGSGLFENGLFDFLKNHVNPRTDYNPAFDGELIEQNRLPVDFGALPQLIVENLGAYPPLFRQLLPDSYHMTNVDLHV